MSEPTKGAFKHLLPEKRPELIPLTDIPALEKFIVEKFGHLGDCYFTDSVKKAKKDTTGDLDVIFVPKVSNWKTEILSRAFVTEHVKNGKQLMTVMENCIGNGKRYMIDFLITDKDELAFKKLFYSYGTMFSALLGSFARSIGYKFTDRALFRKVKDNRGQWHHYFITNRPDTAMIMLGLDPNFIFDDAIFTPEGIASWIVSSSRFDSDLWNSGNPDTGFSINKNTRDAIKKKSEVRDAYDLICMAEKKSIYPVDSEIFEARLLGSDFLSHMWKKINTNLATSDAILTGTEIMEILKIEPGPMIGKVQRYVANYFKGMSSRDKKSYTTKQAAKRLILEFKDGIMIPELCS